MTAERGHAGGWRIAADLETVSLRRLHEALGEPAIFAIGNRNETPDCLVEQSVTRRWKAPLPRPRLCC